MLSIDEAIARERELSERNLILLDFDELVQKSYDTYLRAEYHEQIVMWLEELKVLKENSISKEAFEKMKSRSHNHGYRQGYTKAIDDFSHELKEVFNLEIPLNYPSTKPFFALENARKLVEDVAKQLKVGGKNDRL